VNGGIERHVGRSIELRDFASKCWSEVRSKGSGRNKDRNGCYGLNV
jgi:hypothetical protein